MHILIVEANRELGALWQRHLEREGHAVALVETQAEAIRHLQTSEVHVIVLNVMLPNGSALAVSDFASYRWPKARVVFVTNSTFFSDGSIFAHAPNAAAFVPAKTDPRDLAIMVSHHGEAAERAG